MSLRFTSPFGSIKAVHIVILRGASAAMFQFMNGLGGNARTQSEAAMDEERSAKRARPAQVPGPFGQLQNDDKAMEGTWDGSRTRALLLQEIPDQDEVLVQMLQTSGARTYDQVVDFCISCKIPLSRMLRLDLIRVIQEPLPSGSVSCGDDMAVIPSDERQVEQPRHCF